MIYLNSHQPRRPSHHPKNGEKLMFRTYPVGKRMGGPEPKIYKTCQPSHRLAQMVLYRWSRSDQFVDVPSCGDLYEYLVVDQGFKKSISRKAFGSTIVNALDYECRKLRAVSKTNDKVRQVYHFWCSEELQYGLEYMICAWLRRFLKTQTASGGAADLFGPEVMEEELDILASSSHNDFMLIYAEPMFSMDTYRIDEPDWSKQLRLYGLHNETTEEAFAPPVVRNTPLKSY